VVVAAHEETLGDLIFDIPIDLQIGRLIPIERNQAADAALGGPAAR